MQAAKIVNIRENYRNQPQERKDAEKKVVTGAGATAGAVQVSRTKSAFSFFNSSKKLQNGVSFAQNTMKEANLVAKKTTGLWATVKANCAWAKNSVLKWGEQFKALKYIRPLIESPVFKGAAGIAGFGFGLVTLITGASEIAKTATDVIDEHQLNKAA